MFRSCPHSGASKAASLCIYFIIQVMAFAPDLEAGLFSPSEEQAAGIIGKMKAAYAQIEDYQAEIEVGVYHEGAVVEMERFLYTFKKPNHIRFDVESPYPGMIIVFPDDDGKVVVKPGGLFGFLKLRLSPDSFLLRTYSGQRIDRTDMGLLIENIAHSLTDRRRGEIKLSERDGRLLVEVPAEDHFLAGVVTLYHFYIDKSRWLPVGVKEFTPDGVIKREVIFRKLRTSVGIPDSFFRIDGENLGHDRPGR